MMKSLSAIIEELSSAYPVAVAKMFQQEGETNQETISRVIFDGVIPTEDMNEEAFLSWSQVFVKEHMGKYANKTYKMRGTPPHQWRDTRFNKIHGQLFLSYSPKFIGTSDSLENLYKINSL